MRNKQAPNVGPKRRARPDVWTFEIRVGDRRALASERSDRNNIVEIRWTDPRKMGRERRSKHSLQCVVRDEQGILDAELVAAAKKAAIKFFNEHIATAEHAERSAPVPAMLTLAEGVALAFAPDGPTLALLTPSEVRTLRGYTEIALNILGGEKPWVDIVPGDVAKISDACARYHTATGRGGARTTERIIATLFRVASWLRQHGHIPTGAAVHPTKWRKEHLQAWEAVTQRKPAVARPRHSKKEFAAILTAWGDADPRLHLAMELGAELRLGQVLATPRSNLAVGLPCDVLRLERSTQFGAVCIPGKGKKTGGTVYLTASQRAAVDQALAGHLAGYEAAFRRGEIRDYPLFPKGALVDGVIVPVEAPAVWNRRVALRAFHALEVLAGVTPVPGRGWYGIRRQVTDLAPKFTDDPRVLDHLSFNTEDTRQRIYQNRLDEKFCRKAAKVRDKLRAKIRKKAANASLDEAASPPTGDHQAAQ